MDIKEEVSKLFESRRKEKGDIYGQEVVDAELVYALLNKINTTQRGIK